MHWHLPYLQQILNQQYCHYYWLKYTLSYPLSPHHYEHLRHRQNHFLHLRVITDDGLRIDGLRVHYRLELLPPDAALGCAVDVPTLSGPVTLQVPPGSSSGRLLRLRGRGLQLGDDCGDQLVEIVIVIPAALDDDERALYQRLQELSLERANTF